MTSIFQDGQWYFDQMRRPWKVVSEMRTISRSKTVFAVSPFSSDEYNCKACEIACVDRWTPDRATIFTDHGFTTLYALLPCSYEELRKWANDGHRGPSVQSGEGRHGERTRR